MSITERVFLENKLLQAELKIQQLQKVNTQLSRIIQSSQIPQYKQLLNRLSSQQKQSSSKISELSTKISQLQIQLSFNQSRSKSIISEYEHKLQCSNNTIKQLQYKLYSIIEQNNTLKKQLNQKKAMLKNQQNLLDDYKRSIQEEKQIQTEINKCQLKSIQAKINQQLSTKIKHIKKYYEKQLQKYHKINLTKQYQKDIYNLKLFLTQKKNKQYTNNYQQKQILENSYINIKDNNNNNHIDQSKQNFLFVDFQEQKDHVNYHTENSSLKINHIERKDNISNKISVKNNNVKKAQQSLSSTLQTSLHNYQTKTTQKSATKKPVNNFNSINLSNQFNQRQPLKETQRTNNRPPSLTNQKAFMTEKLRSDNKQQQQQNYNESIKKLQNKQQIPKNTTSKKKENKQNYYIIDEFRQDR